MTATAVGAYVTPSLLKEVINKTDTNDDTLLQKICDRVCQVIESRTRQVVAPIASATYLYDGDNLRRIYLPMPQAVTDVSPPAGSQLPGIGGLRSISLLRIAPNTGGTFETVDAGDYFPRQRAEGPGAPYRWLVLSDRPVGTYFKFPSGIANVEVTGPAGWTAIPDDLTELAINVAARAWNAKESGIQDVAGVDEQGQPIVARYLAGRDKETLKLYAARAAA